MPLASWISASHTSDAVCTGVGPSVVPVPMTVVSMSVQAACLRLAHWCRLSTPDALSQNCPHVTLSFASPEQLLYG